MENSLSKKIYYLRKKNGLTLEAVANVVGVGKSTVRKWETGTIANMRRDKIALLAEALHTTPAYLMGWIDEETNKKNDQLAELVVRLRHDETFANAVSRLAELTPAQFATIDQLLADLTKK